MTRRVGLQIEPLDVLFFRDGRPFGAGQPGSGGIPMPQTLAGAVRTHLWRELGVDFDELANALKKTGDDVTEVVSGLLKPKDEWAARIRVRGPWLFATEVFELTRGDRRGPLVPAPADLVRLRRPTAGKELVRLRPQQRKVPGWLTPTSAAPKMMPLWQPGPEAGERVVGFLTPEGLKKYLAGGVPTREQILSEDGVICWEERTGIGVDPDRNRAADEEIYSVRLLRLRQGITLYAEVTLPKEAPPSASALLDCALPLGGEGRRAVVKASEAFDWPVVSARGDGPLTLLVTPGIFEADPTWAPDAIDRSALVSAAVAGTTAVSGWDLARRRPKPVRHAVAAGSVYLYGPADEIAGEPFAYLGKNQAWDALGYGQALKGVWSYA